MPERLQKWRAKTERKQVGREGGAQAQQLLREGWAGRVAQPFSPRLEEERDG